MKGRDTCVEEAALDCTRTTPKHTVSEPPKQMFNIEMCERFREREFGLRRWKGLGLMVGASTRRGLGCWERGQPQRGLRGGCAALQLEGEPLQAFP